MSVASEPIDRGRAGSLALRYALRELRGGLRGFYVFIACIALGVMAIAGVGSVSASFSDGLAREGRTLLGGDVAFALIQREAKPDEIAYLFEAFGGEVGRSDVAFLSTDPASPDFLAPAPTSPHRQRGTLLDSKKFGTQVGAVRPK